MFSMAAACSMVAVAAGPSSRSASNRDANDSNVCRTSRSFSHSNTCSTITTCVITCQCISCQLGVLDEVVDVGAVVVVVGSSVVDVAGGAVVGGVVVGAGGAG